MGPGERHTHIHNMTWTTQERRESRGGGNDTNVTGSWKIHTARVYVGEVAVRCHTPFPERIAVTMIQNGGGDTLTEHT